MRLARLAKLALLVITASLSTGCATLFTGAQKHVQLDSDPRGAEVLVEGQFKGRTPMQLSYSGMTKDVQLQLRMPGYRDQWATLTRDFEPVAILNCTSILCWGVDILTGSMWKFPPGTANFRLVPIDANAIPGAPGAPGPDTEPPMPPPDIWGPPPPPPPD